jgi:hypothetical protein
MLLPAYSTYVLYQSYRSKRFGKKSYILFPTEIRNENL